MNILHHKSWHVYSQKNRDKVQEDEAKAGAEEKEREKERIEKERDTRLQQLRSRAQSRYGGAGQALIKEDTTYNFKHFNQHALSLENRTSNCGPAIGLKEISTDCRKLTTAGLVSSLNNIRHVEPIAPRSPSPIESHPLEKLDFQKEFLNHLDTKQVDESTKSSTESKKQVKGKPQITNMFLVKESDSKPWYHKESFDQIPEAKRSKDQKRKLFHDPFEDITKRLKRRSGPEREKSPVNENLALKSVDRLRAERIEREAKERERTRLLLSSSRFLDKEPIDPPLFHSQYNPQDTYKAKNHLPIYRELPLPVKKHKSKKSKKEKKSKSSKSSR